MDGNNKTNLNSKIHLVIHSLSTILNAIQEYF